MLRNYLSIAWRIMTRHRLYTSINVIGLAIGICSCLAIWSITRYELRFDKFHPGRERLYRLVSTRKMTNGEIGHWGDVAEPTVPQARLDISGLEAIARFHNYDATVTIPGVHGQVTKIPKAGGT